MAIALPTDTGHLKAVDPATGETIGTVPVTSGDRVPEIVERVRAAQVTWSAVPFVERAKALTARRTLVVRRAEEIAELKA